MTENDRMLIEKAEKLSYIDWALSAQYEKQADTQEAKTILHTITNRLYHTEEYWAGLL